MVISQQNWRYFVLSLTFTQPDLRDPYRFIIPVAGNSGEKKTCGR